MHPASTTSLTTEEAAAFLRLSPHTLVTWRSRGRGPAFIKGGGSVTYLLADLHSWQAANRQEPQEP